MLISATFVMRKGENDDYWRFRIKVIAFTHRFGCDMDESMKFKIKLTELIKIFQDISRFYNDYYSIIYF